MDAVSPSPETGAAALRGVAEGAPEEGLSVAGVSAALGERGAGLLIVLAGLILLIPVAWVAPQIAGLIAIAAGMSLSGGKPAPVFGQGARMVSKPALGKAASAGAAGLGWLEGVIKPRLAGLIAPTAAGLAVIAVGVFALAGGPHLWAAIALIVVGLGLIERDGATLLAGFALALAWSVFMATMAAGLALGAEFALGWAHESLPWWPEPAGKPAT